MDTIGPVRDMKDAARSVWKGLRSALLPTAAVVAVVAFGCRGGGRREAETRVRPPRGALTAAALREAYGTPAFVVRRTVDGRHEGVRDVDLPPDAMIDDTYVVVFAEGAGDTAEGFYRTAGLLAESPYGFPEAPDHLTILHLKWSESTSVAREHLNRAAHIRGAAALDTMLEVHRRRHGKRGRISVIGFSSGTHVIKLAFEGARPEGRPVRRKALDHADHVVFLGSSIGGEDPTPYETVRGRFLNFVNPRDTHYGDRAVYVAPSGQKVRWGAFLKGAPVLRRPHFGASVAGFRHLPTLTAPEQFEAIEAIDAAGKPEPVARAFKMVNVRVPAGLIPYNTFGQPVASDDVDDLTHLARNHYIMVGRGAQGRTGIAEFAQYRAVAEEFVREMVASAATHGRVYRFTLRSEPRGASPVKVPLPVPWAIVRPPGGTKPADPETPDEPAKPDASEVESPGSASEEGP